MVSAPWLADLARAGLIGLAYFLACGLGLLFQVTVAYSGPEGVQAAERWRPHVVVCDVGLPGLDGFGVASTLRHSAATATTRLIAVTGYGQEEDRRRTREAGFDLHLTKPVDPEELQRALVNGSS